MRVLLVSVLLSFALPWTAGAQEDEPPDYVAAGWKQIVNTKADYSLKGTEDPDSRRVTDYWYQIKAACVAEFDKMAESARSKGEIDQFTEAYVGLFGKEGPQADIRWAFACSGVLFLNRTGAYPGYEDLAESFTTHIVEACLTSPAYYQRLHWFRRWAGDVSNRKDDFDRAGTHLSVVRDCMKCAPHSGSYQFAVTNFLMHAYLCGWEDNFSDFTPPGDARYFRAKFRKFFSYYLKNASSLQFDRKEYRFRKPIVTLVPGWLKEERLPVFATPSIPFPDAKSFPPIQQPYGSRNRAWGWFRF